MSYETWTWLAIGVLVLGAPVIFVWFLKDAAKLLGRIGRAGREPPDG